MNGKTRFQILENNTNYKYYMKIIRLFSLLILVLIPTRSFAQTLFKTELHYPQILNDTDLNKAKISIVELMKKETKISGNDISGWGNPKDIKVFDDRIEFTVKNQKEVISFSAILDQTIVVNEVSMSENNGPYYLIRYELPVSNFTFYYRMDYTSAMQSASNLYFIQQSLRKTQFSSQLSAFITVAEQYRALKEKPSISEEMRRFIVQANAFNEKKQYAGAIESYNKAIKTDPTSYPAAYSNLALLSAQIDRYDAAVFYMKEYLLLVPDASDARTAQDKIYEWESVISE